MMAKEKKKKIYRVTLAATATCTVKVEGVGKLEAVLRALQSAEDHQCDFGISENYSYKAVDIEEIK